MNSESAITSNSATKPQPTIGVITALPHERAAFIEQFNHSVSYHLPSTAGGYRCDIGYIVSKHGGEHCVALIMLPDMGNNIASARATLLLEHFPSVTSIIMVGIAGGVPHPTKPDDHVRLGDIVVSDRKGVIQYDFTKETISEVEHRHPPRPPDPTLLEAVRFLASEELRGEKPWISYIDSTSLELSVHSLPDTF